MAPEKTKNETEEEKITPVSPEKTEEVKNNEIDKEKDKANEDAKKKALDALKNQKAGIVNIEEIAEAEARKAADAYMTESKESLKGVKGFLKKMWKHTFFDEYYRQREVNRVRKEIKDTGNIYSRRLNNDKSAHENAMRGISERFISEYEGTLSKGEEKKILDEKDPETVNAKTNIKNLINDYASGKIDEEAFRKNKKDIIDSLKSKEDLLKGANNYADNLFEIAQNAKLAIEHGAKLEELDYDLDIIVGKAKSSLKTEAHFNWVDKGIDKMKKSGVGRFVSPAVLSTAVGLAYSITVGTSKKLMSSKAAALISLGGSVAVSSAFAGVNESQRVALERKQHGIEMAEGGSFEAGDKRREQMEKYEYQMESSKELYQYLYNSMFEKDKDGKDVLKDLKQEDLDAIFVNLSDIEARNNLNERNRIDLISYSNIGNVEKERTDLTILTARAKVELRKKLEGDLKNGLKDYKDFDSYLAAQTQIAEDSLLGGEKGISAQDKAFRKYKAGRIAKKMAQTAVAGLIIGGTIQEAVAFFKDDVQGAVEGIFHTDAHATMQTPFEHVREWISGHPSHMSMGHGVTNMINGHPIISPEGTSIISNPDGTIDVMKGGHSISHFIPKWNPNGTLDEAQLKASGILLNTTHQIIDGTKEVTSNAHDWIQNHPSETIRVHHDGFMDQNTPMYSDPAHPGHLLGSDGNEIKTLWGGMGGRGINENGDAVLNVSHMTSTESFHGNVSVNVPEEMHKGNLMAIIYLDGSVHGQGIPVPVGANGDVIFDHNNPIMQQIFKPDANGQMVSHAKVIEIVQKMGLDKNGVEHIRALGALPGEGLDKIKDFIPFHQDIPIQNIAPSLGVENPLFIPPVARRPLEPVAFGKKEQEDKNEKGKNSKENPVPPIEEKEISAEEELEIAKKEEQKIFAEFKKFTEEHPNEKIPTEMEDRYRKAEENLKLAQEKVEIEKNKKNSQEVNLSAGNVVEISDDGLKQLDKSEAEDGTGKKIKEDDKNQKEESPKEIEKDSKNVEIEKVYKPEDLSKIGTEFKSANGSFVVTEVKKEGMFGLFGKTKIEGIYKDNKGKETLVSYNKKELEKELENGNIKITKVKEEK